MKPKNVKTMKDLCSMKRDNFHYGDYCIGFNSPNELYILQQKLGEKYKQEFIIPKHVFNYFANVFDKEPERA